MIDADCRVTTEPVLTHPDTLLSTEDPPFTEVPIETYIERWEQALHVLQSFTAQQRKTALDMSIWGRRTACGTVACLGGHCSLHPWFRARGFTSEFVQAAGHDTWELHLTGVEPAAFFGLYGHHHIFLKTTRNYGTLVRAVRNHIAYLKVGGNPHHGPKDVWDAIYESDDISPKAYLERWEQGLRLLLNMTPEVRTHQLDMRTGGYRTAGYTVGCLAAHCSLHPWFRVRRFTSDWVASSEDQDSQELRFTGLHPEDFFGRYGHNQVLFNTSLQYEGLVIAVRHVIAYLRAGGDPDAE